MSMASLCMQLNLFNEHMQSFKLFSVSGECSLLWELKSSDWIHISSITLLWTLYQWTTRDTGKHRECSSVSMQWVKRKITNLTGHLSINWKTEPSWNGVGDLHEYATLTAILTELPYQPWRWCNVSLWLCSHHDNFPSHMLTEKLYLNTTKACMHVRLAVVHLSFL